MNNEELRQYESVSGPPRIPPKAQPIRFRALLSKGDDPDANRELRASSWRQLKSFIENYWMNEKIAEHWWTKLLDGQEVSFPEVGTITMWKVED